tara:strand:- start:235 stop:480 length:246 start_codon:yes stop_codon:yes gene_type:complete
MGIDYDDDVKLYYFSYWSSGLSNKKLSWRQRLRYCWQVLTKGKAFEDELIFDQAAVDSLIKHLNSIRPGFPIGDNIVASME